ncbi:M50 family metallopeptidase [Aspergillus fischeri NRRL 181]|uniref:Peptidase M50B-like-domain-containing protein n=1 Tax=Neosartorya fischeri (strain ATCC 1020 / DSM 3700 / CBS 544.65 / FGSC A1164 / JCM 1740 / NRRL 181 / WB 181) TaxID=331117 RepID=A1D7U7_NEOFI|nr:conserved hypothetical protein [Aspergillus fischeri NRRL 181]EAW21791.1 conserved hypothetical protein [Aspergillus fischeri NRRL 181]
MAPYAALAKSVLEEQVSQPHLLKRDLSVNHTQAVTLGVMGAYVVVIALLWNLPYVRWSLWPFKMLVIAFHEFGHAITACCTGGRVKSISLDPHEGGVTHMQGGISAITLPAGYLGSSIIGALLIFAGFDIVASKVASIILGVCFLLTLWWARRDWLTIVTILMAVGLLVACWFIVHGEALRWVVLFIGVMSALYSVWDICDDLILRKVNTSDASVFAQRYGGSSRCWGVIWSIISLGFMAVGIVAAIAAFPQSFSEQQEQSKHFIPTR